MLVVSLPLMAAVSATEPDRFVALDVVAVVVWLIGFLFEAVGDWQLLRFKRDPTNQGQVMDGGLWRYSRHPNYFGETLVWWGFFGFAAAAGAYWSVVGALVITILLLRFSGVTLLEKGLVKTKPAYRDYIHRTSAFFPLPPKR
jgi:steroid 5-alpha reductase family enzyme